MTLGPKKHEKVAIFRRKMSAFRMFLGFRERETRRNPYSMVSKGLLTPTSLYKVFYYVATTLSFSEEDEILLQHIQPAINLIMRGESQLLEVNSLEGGQLRIGLGVAYIPEYCIPADDPDLYCIPILDEIPERKIVTAYSEDSPLSAAAWHFLDLLKENIPSPESF